MENFKLESNQINSETFQKFCNDNVVVGIDRTVRESVGGSFYFRVQVGDASHQLWFAKSFSERNNLSTLVGQPFTTPLKELVVVMTTNVDGEKRMKITDNKGQSTSTFTALDFE